MILPIIANFVKELNTSNQQGFANICVLTHAWHESAGFTRVIGRYNAWGIKTPKKTAWVGPSVTVWTSEFDRVLGEETIVTALPRLQKRWGRDDLRIISQIKGMWKIQLPQTFVDFVAQDEAIRWYPPATGDRTASAPKFQAHARHRRP